MIISMTGYGNYEFENDKISFSMELKSINSKYFELNVKLPYLFSNQEQEISNLLKKELIRGRINFNLSYRIKNSKDLTYILDNSKLMSYVEILNEIKKSAKINDNISIDNILNFQDIISIDKKITDKTKALKQGSPSTSSIVKTPLPAGITAPENEKPKTTPLEAEVLTVKPLAAASPPDAPVTVAPNTLN